MRNTEIYYPVKFNCYRSLLFINNFIKTLKSQLNFIFFLFIATNDEVILSYEVVVQQECKIINFEFKTTGLLDLNFAN
jgi:hypothetical protein